MAPKKKVPNRGIVDPTPSFSTFQGSSAPESPNTSPAPDTSRSSSSSFSPTPQATTGSASQATVHSDLVFCVPQVPGASQTTGVSQLSETPFSPTPQASTGSASQATIISDHLSRAPQDSSTSGALSTCKDPVASRPIPEMASKKSPPIPFDKFASSEIFTIRVGTDLQAFHIHRDLLARLSDEMRNYVYNMKEGQDIMSMEMGRVSPDTIHRFMEFCYSGDYLHASGSENNSDDPLKDKDATEALPLLLTHARLYVFADMFNIVSLKELSRGKIVALTTFFRRLEDRAHALAMISLMDYVFHNIPVTLETPDKLVKFLARYAAFFIGKLGGYPEFHAVLASSAREDFFKVFCKWVKAGKSRAPWANAE